jgi:acyl-CoA reductase-like NAD-dependent aldehyde dehydrogenase
MLIDGKWVDAASGKAFETLNPATGELLATVAEEAMDPAVPFGGYKMSGYGRLEEYLNVKAVWIKTA